MRADRPKQYLTIHGQTLLEHTLNNLLSHPQIGRVILPLHPSDPYFDALDIAHHPRVHRVAGGKERADSVLSGLQTDDSSPWILVHDAARPCLKHSDLNKLLALAEQGTEGGILATPVRDTMKRAKTHMPNTVSHTEDRDGLWHALTPQFFPKAQLLTALLNGLSAGSNITDEASAMEQAGFTVNLIEGCSSNIKVTRPEDLALAEFYLNQRTS